tara:strand:+ start:1923 stop:2693 length:771 start_codon:yes stop_codon:yes gene_type:complete
MVWDTEEARAQRHAFFERRRRQAEQLGIDPDQAIRFLSHGKDIVQEKLDEQAEQEQHSKLAGNIATASQFRLLRYSHDKSIGRDMQLAAINRLSKRLFLASVALSRKTELLYAKRAIELANSSLLARTFDILTSKRLRRTVGKHLCNLEQTKKNDSLPEGWQLGSVRAAVGDLFNNHITEIDQCFDALRDLRYGPSPISRDGNTEWFELTLSWSQDDYDNNRDELTTARITKFKVKRVARNRFCWAAVEYSETVRT